MTINNNNNNNKEISIQNSPAIVLTTNADEEAIFRTKRIKKAFHTNDTTRILWIRPHGNYRTFTFITEISTNETLKKVLNTVFN